MMVRGVIKNYLMKIHGQVRITVKTNQSKLYISVYRGWDPPVPRTSLSASSGESKRSKTDELANFAAFLLAGIITESFTWFHNHGRR